jgi:hypothetical protein
MRRLKQTMILILTALNCAALVSAQPNKSPVSAVPPADQKKIVFTLVNNFAKKSPNPNGTMFLAYYDPQKKAWQKSSQRADFDGRCSFLVPNGSAGESYTFLYGTAQDKLDKLIKAVSDGKGLAWRIPPGKQESLEFLTDGTIYSNVKGNVQMWSIRR